MKKNYKTFDQFVARALVLTADRTTHDLITMHIDAACKFIAPNVEYL